MTVNALTREPLRDSRFYRFDVWFPIKENLFDAGAARGGHDGLHGEFAARVARAFTDKIALQAILNMHGIGGVPSLPGAPGLQQHLAR